MPITIYRKGGLMFINPILGELFDPLTFTYSYKTRKKISYVERSTGRLIEREVDGPVRAEQKPMYTLNEDKNLMITYSGLFQRVKGVLDTGGVEYVVEDIGQKFVEPKITPEVFEGLHPDQKLGAEAMLAFDGGCLAEATMGAGKTYAIAALCRAYSDYMGLIVTNRQSVAQRLYSALTALSPKSDIGIYTATMKKPGRTLIITCNTLNRFDPEKVKFLIYDECHGAASPERAQAVLRYKNAVKYGFSATIRNDFKGMGNYLEAVFGPIVYELNDQQAEELGRVTPLDVHIINVDRGPTFSDRTQNLTMEKNGIWYNRERNRIIRDVVRLVPEDQQVILFARTKFHIDHLMEHWLQDMGFEVYHSKLKTKERNRILAGFNDGSLKRVISTDSLAEGVDPASLYVTINANWVQSDVSVSQKAGRNRRHAEGKNFGVVIDFNDCWDDRMRRKSKNRINKYHDRGYNVIENSSVDQIKFVDLDA